MVDPTDSLCVSIPQQDFNFLAGLRRSKSCKNIKKLSNFSSFIRAPSPEPGITYLGKKRWSMFNFLTGPYLTKESIPSFDALKKKLMDQGRMDFGTHSGGEHGFPWQEAEAFENLEITESLLNLYNLSNAIYQSGISGNPEVLLMLGFEIAHQEKALKTIGKLIDYIANDPKGAASLSGGDALQSSIAKINSHFRKRILQASDQLSKTLQAHNETGLQDSQMALTKILPNIFASFLIPAEGLINLGIADSIKNAFLDQRTSSNCSNLIYGVDSVMASTIIRNALKNVKKPKDDKISSNCVIRISQGLSINDPITTLAAQRTALSALLTHLRQSPEEESCFATSIAIELLNFNQVECVNDFIQLLSTSKLTRHVHGHTQDFPFVLGMNGSCLSKVIRFDKEGILYDDKNNKFKGALWEAPGVQAACLELGINPKAAIKKLYLSIGSHIGSSNKQPNKYQEITLRELLHGLVSFSTNNHVKEDCKVWELFNRACFAYESLTICHPLQRVWENALAGMAEANETSIIKKGMIDSVLKIFTEYARRISPSLKWENSEFEKKIQHQLLKQSFHQYDPGIQKWQEGQKKISSTGAFVLYAQYNKKNSLARVRIDSPKDYQNYLKTLLESVKTKLSTTQQELPENKPYIDFLTMLHAYIDTDHFLIRNLKFYHPENFELFQKHNNYDFLRYTPWITCSGNNPKALLQVYYETDKLPLSTFSTPKNATELLHVLMEKCKEAGNSVDTRSIQPLRMPGIHAFSWMTGEICIPLMTDAETWIHHHIVLPGREVYSTPILPEQKEALMPLVHTHVSNLKCSANPTIAEFRNAILEAQGFSKETFARELDVKVYQTLPLELKIKLEASAFHAFDSNISEGLNDIHYCFIVSPGDGELCLWECLDNKKLIKPLDPKIWFNLQSWEFYKHPIKKL